MSRLVLLAVLVLALPALRASAQRPTLATLQTGDTIKVWAVGPRLSGETGGFAGFSADTLALSALPFTPAAVTRARVPYTALRRVDVRRSRERSTGRMFAGIVIGAAGGLVVGAALGTGFECAATGCDDEFEGLGGFLLGSTVGFVGGGIAGGVIGGRIRPRWESVDLRR